MRCLPSDRPFCRGFRDGLRSVVVCHLQAPAPVARRRLGTLETDRLARYCDMQAFGADLRRGGQDLLPP